MTTDLRNAFTQRLLVEADLPRGGRALDVGCGAGEVTRLAAMLVGPGGHVVGLDLNETAIEAARGLPVGADSATTSFVHGDLMSPPQVDGGYDAIIGRRVLMYQPDAGAAVAALVRTLSPGGMMAFQEHVPFFDAGPWSVPLHKRLNAMVWETVRREGGDLSLGFRLHSLLQTAGIVDLHVRSETVVHTSSERSDTAWLVRMMLPRMLQRSVADAEALDLENLEARLAEELASGATIVSQVAFGVWGRKPEAPP